LIHGCELTSDTTFWQQNGTLNRQGSGCEERSSDFGFGAMTTIFDQPQQMRFSLQAAAGAEELQTVRVAQAISSKLDLWRSFGSARLWPVCPFVRTRRFRSAWRLNDAEPKGNLAW
jgi:hypothetical protein